MKDSNCKGTVGRRLDIGRIDIYWVMYKMEDESLGVRALGIRGEYIYMWPVSLQPSPGVPPRAGRYI
jgi:hypothetical protein